MPPWAQTFAKNIPWCYHLSVGEIDNNSNNKNSILLSRNTPVVLIVGAAGFLGSNLVDHLLDKNIQVIGVDDFSTGVRENLNEAAKNKNFHLITESGQSLKVDLPRLDYLVLAVEGEWNILNVLDLAKQHKSKIVLVSSVDLYDHKSDSNHQWLKSSEEKLAKFASENHLNARVVRLSGVYGPRMHFRLKDPIVRLIQESLLDELQKDTMLDFSTRALYVDDAVNLIVKSVLAGSTAQKIFDGCLPSPLKIADVKQILLDPLWYENKGFEPTELPPWITPNLSKTMKELSWHPHTNIVKALRQTISHFKDQEKPVPALARQEIREKKVEVEEKRVEEIKKEEPSSPSFWDKKVTSVEGESKKRGLPKLNFSFSSFGMIAALIVITYALIVPVASLAWGFLTFRANIQEASKQIQAGEFDKSLESISRAEVGISITSDFLDSIQVFRQIGLFNNQLAQVDDLMSLANLTVEGTRHVNFGTKALYESLKSITGEQTSSSKENLDQALIEFSAADERFSKAQVILNNDFINSLPGVLKIRVEKLNSEFGGYSKLVKSGRALSSMLPEVVALEGKKSYLVLLQNNNELRPTGGFIGSFARIDFEGGKLKKIDVNDIYNIDGNLKIHVEPPKEIKSDLGQKDWFLRDSNWEPDFPTSARQAEWFYNQETGNRVDGVVVLNLSAIEDLLSVVGPLDLSDYDEKITADNLFERSVTHAEQGFFPGSQSKKSFVTALVNELFNKMFFLPNQNWPGVMTALGKSLDEKQLLIYLNDPKLFSFIVSQNWAGAFPRPADSSEGNIDFLSTVEANLGANKTNFYLDRNFNLQTTIGKEGEIGHRLKINYTNRSPSDVWPAGKYKNRFRVYLPFGSSVSRILWGESDVTKQASIFADYGRTGYSILVELNPKEQKALIIDYTLPNKLDFKGSQAIYRLDIIKQAGTLKDPFTWKIAYPINVKVVGSGQEIGPQEYSISTDMSSDRSFEVTLEKR